MSVKAIYKTLTILLTLSFLFISNDVVGSTLEVKDSYIGQKVTYYGRIRTISTSGSFSFYFYNPKTYKPVKPGNPYNWFWADLADIDNYPKNEACHDYLQEQDGVFKVTGWRDENDIDYYSNGIDYCSNVIVLPSITIDNIVPLKPNNNINTCN